MPFTLLLRYAAITTGVQTITPRGGASNPGDEHFMLKVLQTNGAHAPLVKQVKKMIMDVMGTDASGNLKKILLVAVGIIVSDPQINMLIGEAIALHKLPVDVKSDNAVKAGKLSKTLTDAIYATAGRLLAPELNSPQDSMKTGALLERLSAEYKAGTHGNGEGIGKPVLALHDTEASGVHQGLEPAGLKSDRHALVAANSQNRQYEDGYEVPAGDYLSGTTGGSSGTTKKRTRFNDDGTTSSGELADVSQESNVDEATVREEEHRGTVEPGETAVDGLALVGGNGHDLNPAAVVEVQAAVDESANGIVSDQGLEIAAMPAMTRVKDTADADRIGVGVQEGAPLPRSGPTAADSQTLVSAAAFGNIWSKPDEAKQPTQVAKQPTQVDVVGVTNSASKDDGLYLTVTLTEGETFIQLTELRSYELADKRTLMQAIAANEMTLGQYDLCEKKRFEIERHADQIESDKMFGTPQNDVLADGATRQEQVVRGGNQERASSDMEQLDSSGLRMALMASVKENRRLQAQIVSMTAAAKKKDGTIRKRGASSDPETMDGNRSSQRLRSGAKQV